MSKRENKRIRQLERRVEKLEQALYGGRVPDYQIQVTAGGTPEMLDELGKKLAESIQKAFSCPPARRKHLGLWSSLSPPKRPHRALQGLWRQTRARAFLLKPSSGRWKRAGRAQVTARLYARG